MNVKQYKKWLILLVFCMTMFAVPITVHAVAGEIWVNGVNIVTALENTVQCGEGKAVYNKADGTLTLENATISDQEIGSGVIDIQSGTPLNLILVGNNKITSAGNSDLLVSSSDLTISGDGNLTIEGAGTGEGIRIKNSNLTIDGTTVTVNNENGGSIYVDSDITIQQDSVVGINSIDGLWAIGNMTISHSEVTSNTPMNNGEAAFYTAGALTIENNSSVTASSGYATALYSNGKIEIADSIVHAESTVVEGIWSETSLTITGDSEIIATGGQGAIETNGSATLTPPTGKAVEIMVGADELSAQSTEGSPFSEPVNLLDRGLNTYNYFHSKTVDSTPSQKEETATITATAVIPAPTYTVTIPTTVNVGELVRKDAGALDKIKSTPFTVSASNVDNLFGQKINVAVSAANDSFELADDAEKLAYSVFNTVSGGSALTSGEAFVAFTEAGEKAGRIEIDQSTITRTGSYTGNMTFTISLADI